MKACDCFLSKFGVAALFIVLTFVCGYMPLMLKSFLQRKKVKQSKVDEIVSMSLIFGAGVLFATSIMHMLYEAREELTILVDSGFIKLRYPYAELFIGIGFIFIYALEEFILYYFGNAECHIHANMEEKMKEKEMIPANVQLNGIVDSQSAVEIEPCTHAERVDMEAKISLLRTSIFLFALSIHTVFEGLAIGIAETTSEVWILAGAIASHKIFVVFGTGSELIRQTKKVYFISISILALMPTIGTVLGIFLQGHLSGANIGDFTLSFLTSFSGGVILFVVFCEILEKERSKNIGRVQNMISFAVGFLCMAAILLVPEEISAGNRDSFNELTTINSTALNTTGDRVIT